MEPTDRHEMRFLTTAAASADARGLANPGLLRLDLVADVVGLGLGILLLSIGIPILGVIVLVVAALSVLETVYHALQRALLSVRARPMLGREARVTFDGEGARFDGELGTTFVQWSSVTAVRSNGRTVALFRDNLLLGYVPASAFSSPEHQAQVVAFARSKLPSRA